jgi:iron(III) transport system substrate-binding protein
VHFTEDFTPAFSRLALITVGAPHPNAAKLFMEFMLSAEGQGVLSASGLPSIRADVTTDGLSYAELNERVGGNLSPIPLDEWLLALTETANRIEFLDQWNSAIGH